MNLAIIISIAEYQNTINLEGCINDAIAIKSTLEATNKFDRIKTFSGSVDSSHIKQELVQLIREFENEKISEVFFYFSGHGLFQNNEFYYVMSNYDANRINSTCLQNSELDNYFKNLKPELFIKVIDACQSGLQYIKDTASLDYYFQSGKQHFDKCYFMNSCLNTQSSYQSEKISDFTLAFIESLLEVKENSIRYKNIMDYISDKFNGNTSQNPLFIVQAKYVEEFCSNNSVFNVNIKKVLESIVPQKTAISKEQNLLDLIVEESKMHTSYDESIEILNSIQSKFENAKPIPELEKLFSTKMDVILNGFSIICEEEIAQFLFDSDIEYFAKSNYTSEWIKHSETPAIGAALTYSSLLSSYAGGRYEYSFQSFNPTFVTPFKGLTLNYIRRYQNIENYNCTITYLLNSTQIVLFYFYEKYISKNWEEFIHSEEIEWNYNIVKLKDRNKIEVELEKILSGFNQFVLKSLKKEYGLIEESKDNETNKADKNDST